MPRSGKYVFVSSARAERELGYAYRSGRETLARAVLWKTLPFHDAERLVFVWEETERDGQPHAARVTAGYGTP